MSLVFQSIPTSQEKLKLQYENMIACKPLALPSKEDQILTKLNVLGRDLWRMERMLRQLTEEKDKQKNIDIE
jgi:hypothetical protein